MTWCSAICHLHLKREDEIQQILNEGLISDDGYMEVSAIGKKDGRDIEVITLVNAPGLAESFAKSGHHS